MDDYQKPDKLENLEKRLYSTRSEIKPKERHQMEEKNYNVSTEWNKQVSKDFDEDIKPLTKKRGLSIFTKIFLVSLLFFLGASAYAYYIFVYNSGPDAENVDISINSSVSVGAAQEFTFDIIVQNNNEVEMQTVDLAIEYPEGTRDGKDVSISLPRERYSIGEITPGSYLRETKTVFLFGEEGEKKEIEVKVVYRIADSNDVFEKKKIFDVVLTSTPIKMNVSSVREITAGQELTFEVEVASNANEKFGNVLVSVDYPFGFVFESSSLTPQEGNKSWFIGELEPRETIKFNIKGELQGQNNDDKLFKFNIGIKDIEKIDEIGVLFSSIARTVVIQRPFLEIDLSIDNNNSSVINLDPNKNYQMKINYRNNTNAVIKDAQIVLKLEGDVLARESIQVSSGFYKSIDNSIIWDKTTYSDFENIGIGKSGSLSLNFRTKDLTKEERFINPEIALSAKVEGLRYEDPEVPEKIVNEVFKKLRFNSTISFMGKSLGHTGPFSNSGPIPPKVENTTTYTIFFDILNSSNRLANATVEMSLPNYITYLSKIWPDNSDINYDSRSRKLIWKIGEIKEETGYKGLPIQGAFQISITPSLSQRGDSPVLVDNIKFSANDLFTGKEIIIDGGQISTDISDSSNYFEGNVSQ